MKKEKPKEKSGVEYLLEAIAKKKAMNPDELKKLEKKADLIGRKFSS
ncbi:hypothetical protein SDC9_46863 [bioreactor metagenome]|uniref:Uncharacterized protein n=1 Tax=bioreactor metagenome TaxID=1076179 RepID=A0A644W9Z3_9ZZZZ